MMKNARKCSKNRKMHAYKSYKGKQEVILKPTKKLVGKQRKYIGRRKNIMKKKSWKNHKRNIKEID